VNDHLATLRSALSATVVHPRGGYSWFGERSPALSAGLRRVLADGGSDAFLVHMLQGRLYADFYCRGAAGPSRRVPVVPRLRTTPFVEQLSAAVAGRGCWDGGWVVRDLSGTQIVVERDGLRLWVRPEQCQAVDQLPLGVGVAVRLSLPKALPFVSPGFHYVLGDRQPADARGSSTRVYWHLSAEAAAPFVQHATSWLDASAIPFSLKVLRDPALFVRCDAAVIYLSRRDYPNAVPVLSRLHVEVATGLRASVPALTKRLAPGVGVADDPGAGESFGMHRCRLIADGVVRAHRQGCRSIDDRLDVVAKRFAEDGISLERPYLGAGVPDDYQPWQLGRARR
jgi:hypothetical protein